MGRRSKFCGSSWEMSQGGIGMGEEGDYGVLVKEEEKTKIKEK